VPCTPGGRLTTQSRLRRRHPNFTDAVFTERLTRGRMSIKTAAATELLRMIIRIHLFSETLLLSRRKMTSAFSAESNSVMSLVQAYFVPPLKETSFTTALGAALTSP